MLRGHVEGKWRRVKEVSENPNGHPDRRIDGNMATHIDNPPDPFHSPSPVDGFGPTPSRLGTFCGSSGLWQGRFDRFLVAVQGTWLRRIMGWSK